MKAYLCSLKLQVVNFLYSDSFFEQLPLTFAVLTLNLMICALTFCSLNISTYNQKYFLTDKQSYSIIANRNVYLYHPFICDICEKINFSLLSVVGLLYCSIFRKKPKKNSPIKYKLYRRECLNLEIFLYRFFGFK